MTSMLKSYQDLEVWKGGMELAKTLYKATEALPKSETYGLTHQLRTAAISIPANIAEGYARQHRKEYMQFLSIAQGSQAELTTLLLLTRDIHCLKEADHLLERCDTVGRMLTRLRQSLQAHPQPQPLTPKPRSSPSPPRVPTPRA